MGISDYRQKLVYIELKNRETHNLSVQGAPKARGFYLQASEGV